MNVLKQTSRRPLLALLALSATLTTAASALTVEQSVTPASLHDGAKQFAVKLKTNDDGLLQFTVTYNAKEPRYLVARSALRHNGKLIAESDTPLVSRKGENTFYFAVAPEDVKDSSFSISESYFQELNGQILPEVGTIIYEFKLPDFVVAEAPKNPPVVGYR